MDAAFPPRDGAEPPAWLPWSEAEWPKVRESWFTHTHELLSVDTYLRDFLKAGARQRPYAPFTSSTVPAH